MEGNSVSQRKGKNVCYIYGIDLCFSHMDSHESCFSLRMVNCVPDFGLLALDY
jgi:hypothetical protein